MDAQIMEAATAYEIKPRQAVALETRRVAKTYPSDLGLIRDVDGVSVEVRQGEFVALVGPGGSG